MPIPVTIKLNFVVLCPSGHRPVTPTIRKARAGESKNESFLVLQSEFKLSLGDLVHMSSQIKVTGKKRKGKVGISELRAAFSYSTKGKT